MKTFLIISVNIMFALVFQKASAQSWDRDVIGSAGMYTVSTDGSMAWTIGEVMIETYSASGSFFTQGFHQPNIYVAEPEPVWDFFIPEGFSPNGDEINDPFFIRGIDHYPKNSITIFNRWGDKVFEANPYENNWYGKSTKGLRIAGDDLPVGTYFYLFDKGDGSKIIKGTIYLNR